MPVRVGAVLPPVTVKLAFPMSKKILPTAATRMRACVVAGVPAGMVKVSVPSFSVLAVKIVGNVKPPSRDRAISMFAVLTPLAVVPATFQVMLWLEPAAQLTAVSGAVTIKGPANVVLVTATDASLVPPPPARLSRAVTRKFIVRPVVGNTSAVSQLGVAVPGSGAVAGATFALLRMKRRLGKMRVGEGVGSKLRKMGRLAVSTMLPSGLAVPRSNCSQT